CRRGSICSSCWPVATRSPDFTKICVTWPSICGWIVVERSDFSVATYSVASSIGVGAAVTILTGAGGNAIPPGAADWPRLHAAARGVAATAAAGDVTRMWCFDSWKTRPVPARPAVYHADLCDRTCPHGRFGRLPLTSAAGVFTLLIRS